MALNHEIHTALDDPAAVRDELRLALLKRMSYQVADAEDPTSLDFTGADVLAISHLGVEFKYDPTDTTTAHDGTTTIVTADGKRFKADGYTGSPSRVYVVQDKDLTAPPGSPTAGDHYIVAAGSTGDWATHDDEIASFTARGWRFITPATYDRAYIVDEAADYHLNGSGNWVQGQPGIIIAAASVGLTELELGLGLAVENQTTNTPPGSPTAGAAYIIGPSPTGAWAGNARKLARFESSAWVIRTPANGWMVRDKATQAVVVYDGTIWANVSAGLSALKTASASGEVAMTIASSTAYPFDPTSLPSSATHRHALLATTLTHTAVASGRKMVFTFDGAMEINANAGYITMALHRDAETAPLAIRLTEQTTSGQYIPRSARFEITSDDSSSHEYKIRAYFNTTGGTTANVANPLITMMELSG